MLQPQSNVKVPSAKRCFDKFILLIGRGVVFGHRTLASFPAFYFVVIAHGIGLRTFIIMCWIIRVWHGSDKVNIPFGVVEGWNIETGSSFANTLPADKNWKLEKIKS